jgi:hypothetical protein
MHLYELVGQYRALEALESSEDIPPEVIRDTLEGLEGQLQEKATNVALFIRNLVSTADAIYEAANQMRERADRLKARSDALYDYLLFNMQASGITKIESPYFSLIVKKNPPTVVIDNEADIPEDYKVAPPPPPKRIDKAAIGRAFKAGEAVPGCHIEQRERLEVKV